MKEFFTKAKIIFSGTLLAVLILLIGVGYSYFKYDKNAVDVTSVIQGKFFQILKKFKEENIDFNNFNSMVSSTFSELQDNRNMVEPNGNGRTNPFAP